MNLYKNKKIRVGIAGLGHQGKIHLCNLLRLRKNVDIVAIADKNKKNIILLNKKFGNKLKIYDSYEDMYNNEKIDLTIITLPNYLHGKAIVSAIKNDIKNIFVEKPFTFSLEEARKIKEYLRKNDVKLMIGCNKRFNNKVINIKRIIDKGELGIKYAFAQFFVGPFFKGTQIPEWWFDKKRLGGGVLLDNGYHILDLFLWMFGTPTYVKGNIKHRLNLELEDFAEIYLEFDNGIRAIGVIDWFTRIPSFTLGVFGYWGSKIVSDTLNINTENIAKILFEILLQKTKFLTRYRTFLPLGYEEYYLELKYFIECIINDKNPQPSVDEGIKVMEIIDKIYRDFGLIIDYR